MAGSGPGTATVDQLTEPLRSEALALVAASGGRVWIQSGWRSRAEQQALYDAHCDAQGRCNPPTAKPGSSQHEAGRAVDFGGDLNLAAQLAGAHNLVRTVPTEAWHYEDAANRSVGGGTGGVGSAILGLPAGIPNPLDAANTVKTYLEMLTDTHRWLRIAMVLGGIGLVILGLAVLGLDVRDIAPDTKGPAGSAITDAAGAGKALA